MKPSFMRAAGTRNPDAATRWLRALLLLGSALCCSRAAIAMLSGV